MENRIKYIDFCGKFYVLFKNGRSVAMPIEAEIATLRNRTPPKAIKKT